MAIVEGKVAFSNLTKHEKYNGESTGKFSIVLTLDDEAGEKLESQKVKLKSYQDSLQKKFYSQYPVKVVDKDDSVYPEEIPKNSRVRVAYKLGPENPAHGCPTYLNAVRVLEGSSGGDLDEGF